MPHKPDQVAAANRSGVNQKITDGNNLCLVVRNGRGFWFLECRDEQKTHSKGLRSESTENVVRRRWSVTCCSESTHHSALPWAEVPVLMREFKRSIRRSESLAVDHFDDGASRGNTWRNAI
jgi:hypothetical protein